METKTVKLYSLDYSNVKTYLIAALFIAGQYGITPTFPPYTARRHNMVAHLFLHLNRRI